MSHRWIWAPLSLVAICLGGVQAVSAQDPRLDALGGASVVVETDTSMLSLFNFGNPAGAVFLPHQDRLDVDVQVGERDRWTEFTTLYSHLKTSTDLFDMPVDAYGNTTYVDAFGNVLAPATVYSRRSRTVNTSLDDWGPGAYGGYLFWLDPAWVLQVDPLAQGSVISSTDQPSGTSAVLAGGRARGAWLAAPDVAIGLGLTTAEGNAAGWGQPEWQPDMDGNTTNPRVDYVRRDFSLGTEIGAAWRQASVFETQDRLDLGLNLKYAERTFTLDESLHADANGTGAIVRQQHVQTVDHPEEIQFQGVYNYQTVMDIGLVAGYQNERLYRALRLDGQPDVPKYLAETVGNVDYELSLRVRLPMVRQDDLRFGMVFNNRSLGHPYPNGRWLQYLPDKLYATQPILTQASSIGIATAVVPEVGSLITLEYFLGSAKSRGEQDHAALASSGYNRFNLGAQYEVMDGLVVRAGYSDLRVAYESIEHPWVFGSDNHPVFYTDPNTGERKPQTAERTITRSEETSSFNFGVSVGGKPWRVDLAVTVAQTGHSPYGWTLLDKPFGLDNVSQDLDRQYSTTLGLSWLF